MICISCCQCSVLNWAFVCVSVFLDGWRVCVCVSVKCWPGLAGKSKQIIKKAIKMGFIVQSKLAQQTPLSHVHSFCCFSVCMHLNICLCVAYIWICRCSAIKFLYIYWYTTYIWVSFQLHSHAVNCEPIDLSSGGIWSRWQRFNKHEVQSGYVQNSILL